PVQPALPPARPDEPTYVRPRPSGGGAKLGFVLGGLLVFVLGVVAVGAFLLLPRKGQLKIDIKSKNGAPIEKAEIFVDGVKKCDTAPCVVNDLPSGPKTIKVLGADVSTPAVVTESVEAGKERLVLITVDAASGVGLKVAAVEQNVKIFVDGTDKGTLPVELHDVTPGAHKVRFEAGDRYEKLEQAVDVPATGMKDLGTIKLKVLKGQATIDVETKGATVTLVRDHSGKKVTKKIPDGQGPIKLEIDPQEGWKLVATKKGFQDFTQDLSFDDGIAEKTITIALVEESKE